MRGRPPGLSVEEWGVLGGVTASLTAHILQEVAEVTTSTVGCQGQAPPGLALVLVGRHPAALSYMQSTTAAARVAGVVFELHEWPEDVSYEELEACVVRLSNDDAVHGIVLQLPLPPHLDEKRLLRALADEKDVDGIKELNLRRFLGHVESALCPAIAVACDETLRSLKLQPKAHEHAQVASETPPLAPARAPRAPYSPYSPPSPASLGIVRVPRSPPGSNRCTYPPHSSPICGGPNATLRSARRRW